MQSPNNQLLDSNIVIDYLRGRERAISFIEKIYLPKISVVTVGEVYQGALNQREFQRTKDILGAFHVINISEKISIQAVELIAKYHLSSGLFFLDALVASTALENNLTLITANLKHFKMIKELRVEKW